MKRLLFGATVGLLFAACYHGVDNPTVATLTDAGCYLHPETSLEILNACTDAGFVDKHPTLPLLLPDGGLPALP
jgi:hypothetical protein